VNGEGAIEAPAGRGVVRPVSWRGPLFIFAAALLWSSGGLGIKSLALPPLAITGWRSLFALPLLFFCGAFRGAGRKDFREPAIFVTILSYTATLSLFVTATKLTTAANAILLQYTSPFWVILLSLWVFKEKPRARDLLMSVGCFAGLSLFMLDRVSAEGKLGILLAILSGMSMAMMTLGLRSSGRRAEGTRALFAMFFGNVLCSLVCLPAMIRSFGGIDARSWRVLAALGVFQIALPYVLFSIGVREVPPLRATLIAMIEPILNPVWVAWLIHEVPGRGAILGGALILLSLLLDATIPRRAETA